MCVEKCLQVVSSAIIDKYIGESARLIREMFNYARDHQVILLKPLIFDIIWAFLIGLITKINKNGKVVLISQITPSTFITK